MRLLSWLSVTPSSHVHSPASTLEAHLQPAGIEEELQECEDRDNEVHLVARVGLGWVQKLPPNEASQEEAVYCHGHHLGGKEAEETSWVATWG